jgi:hypothetical protein
MEIEDAKYFFTEMTFLSFCCTVQNDIINERNCPVQTCLGDHFLYPQQRSCRGGILVSACPSVCRQILCRTITWVVSLRILSKFYQLFTGEERRIPFIFDDFHFCRSRVIEPDMTDNGIFTLCRMITWVVFLGMFWNFISSLPVKRGGSLSFLTIFTFVVPELLDLIWRKIGFLPYVVWYLE